MSKFKTLEEEIQAFSPIPGMQKMYREQLKIYGSMEGICRAVYGGSNSSSLNPTPSDSQPAGSSGKYMVHCYYGSQPGNKITTVIG
jgi:hypothetical protein